MGILTVTSRDMRPATVAVAQLSREAQAPQASRRRQETVTIPSWQEVTTPMATTVTELSLQNHALGNGAGHVRRDLADDRNIQVLRDPLAVHRGGIKGQHRHRDL